MRPMDGAGVYGSATRSVFLTSHSGRIKLPYNPLSYDKRQFAKGSLKSRAATLRTKTAFRFREEYVVAHHPAKCKRLIWYTVSLEQVRDVVGISFSFL
jgi:hypothetical protein